MVAPALPPASPIFNRLMPNGAACLLDSNILLRISKSDDPQYVAIIQALDALVGQGIRGTVVNYECPGFPALRRSLDFPPADY